jgi:putative NADH-flavin reductase
MKTIALFGGTGQTGSLVLRKAIEHGYKVKALVRSPEKVAVEHTDLTVIKGDILNKDDVRATVRDSDIVISLFGHVKGSPDWIQSDGTKNIVQAMQQESVKKIVSLLSS